MSSEMKDAQMKNDTGPFPCHFGGNASITHSRTKRPIAMEKQGIELMRLALEEDSPRASVRQTTLVVVRKELQLPKTGYSSSPFTPDSRSLRLVGPI